MSLPPLTLDDLTFEDLRLMAVQKIPAASGARWTHHAPVDPGVTLLELFAFLLDQQMFMLDQVPDSMVHAILRLLGEAPRPTQAARTVLAAPRGARGGFALLDEGMPLRPVSTALEDLVFSTREAALIAPVDRLSVLVDGRPIDGELGAGREALALRGQGRPASLRFEVRLARPFQATHAGRDIALALVLADPGVPPEWSADASDAPPPGDFVLAWQAGGGSGTFGRWRDGTGGLRRSGLVRMAVPDAWVGRDEIALTLASGAADHPEPVRLSGVHFGAVIAEHRRRIEIGRADTGDAAHDAARATLAEQIAGWLPISGRILELPAAYGAVFEDDVVVRLRHPRDGWQEWRAAGDLGIASSEARLFTVDRELGQLRFGDGYQGRVPAPAQEIELSSSFGGGEAGNHSPGLEWQALDRSVSLRLVSAVAAEGGAEAETLEQARGRVAASLQQRHRAVTAADYAHLVENAPGIAAHRAHVAPFHDPAFPCVTVADTVTIFVVPHTGAEINAPRADEGALSHIRALLEDARLLTMRVFVQRPRFRPVGLVLTVAGHGAIDYRASLEPVLRAYLHPTLGGPEGTGWPFGAPLRPSELLRVSQDVLPRGARVEKVLIRLLDDGGETDCGELPIGDHELVALEGLSIRLVEPAHSGASL